MAINLSTDMCTKVSEEAEKDKNVIPIRVRQNGVEVESPGCSSSTGYINNGPTTMRSAIARLPENKHNNCLKYGINLYKAHHNNRSSPCLSDVS